MNQPLKFPYGISNYKMLIKRGYLYVDRTAYTKQLEELSDRFLFYLRPRRFGKSLWLSVLHYYYSITSKEDFKDLFENTYIGQHPTPLVNSYLVLHFNFSGINTDSGENTRKGFLKKVKDGVRAMINSYPDIFGGTDVGAITNEPFPSQVIANLLNLFLEKRIEHKVYLLMRMTG